MGSWTQGVGRRWNKTHRRGEDLKVCRIFYIVGSKKHLFVKSKLEQKHSQTSLQQLCSSVVCMYVCM